jgi:hypothetical protein
MSLSLIGTLFLVIAGLGISTSTGGLEWWGWLLVACLAFIGAGFVYASIFSSDQNAEKWSDAASSHEAAVLLILVAFPIAWALRKVFPTNSA